jgi:hydrogenase maturation protease
MNILILGIGQSMRGDDAAGLEAVRAWRRQYPDSAAQVRVELCELPGLALLDLLEGMDAAVLVDAVRASELPGTILRLRPDELESFTSESGSAHGWGVAETLKLGQRMYAWVENCRITLVGIVGKDFSVGAELSPEVRKAIASAADLVEREIQNEIKK